MKAELFDCLFVCMRFCVFLPLFAVVAAPYTAVVVVAALLVNGTVGGGGGSAALEPVWMIRFLVVSAGL